ncbi:MAG TPA: ABC-F family ATP-binding cassette domain-containing protein [Blastocatellia bacterium]|nr:ABC-F family ATP-binding cassette domain-containing protein [Blastocatellia bacterium]
MLFKLDEVKKHYGSQDVLRGATVQINPGEKVALVGRNGAGKTTLFRILAGMEQPDDGTVARVRNLRLGFLQQQVDYSDESSLLDMALSVFAELQEMEREMRRLEHEMSHAEGDKLDQVMHSYSELQHAYDHSGGFSYHARAEAVLLGLGFKKSDFDRPAAKLSGGQKNRLALAQLLLGEPDILLLDEPTNHLDVDAIEWLEEFLINYKSAFIIISHDRYFLDRVVNRIIELDNGKLTSYTGNYSQYVIEREVQREIQQRHYEQQQEMIARTEDFIRRNIAGQKTKQAKSRRKMLAKLDRVEAVQADRSSGDFRLKPLVPTGEQVLVTKDLAAGFADKRLMDKLTFTIWRGEVLGIIGPNGSGKTTLVRTLLDKIAPLDGKIQWGANVVIGYYDQQLNTLDPDGTIIGEIRTMDPLAKDGDLRSFLAKFLFTGDDVFKQINNLSGGEKGRLALAKLIYSRANVLILDEPTNHLDVASREALEDALSEYQGTIIVISHDRYFLDRVATEILYVANGKAVPFDGSYSEWHEALLAEKATAQTASEVPIKNGSAPKKQQIKQSQPKKSKQTRTSEAIEAEIHALEAEFASVGESLASEEAARNPQLLAEISSRYKAIEEQLANLYNEWETVGAETGS